MDIRDVVNMPVHENPTLNLPWAIADRPQLFGSCGNDAFGIGLEMTEPLRALHLINGTHPRAFARLAESAMEFLLRIPPPIFLRHCSLCRLLVSPHVRATSSPNTFPLGQ